MGTWGSLLRRRDSCGQLEGDRSSLVARKGSGMEVVAYHREEEVAILSDRNCS
jgi:hypothetical protein